MKKEYAEAHDNGTIHIHDMDFLAMGTTTCCQIDLARLFKNGFDTGHGFVRPPQDISTYASLACIVIQANQNDQHGGQAIPALDYYLAPGVLKTFKKQFKQTIYDFLDLEGFIPGINIDRIVREIDKQESIELMYLYLVTTKKVLVEFMKYLKRVILKQCKKLIERLGKRWKHLFII